ncbi:MAG: amidophosphoribosyltransferase [Candidatus Omnitrophota bacterium]
MQKSYKPKDHCGVFGVYGNKEAARLTYMGLFALQHRGEESCGIVASDGKNMRCHKAMGLVGDAFDEERILSLNGKIAIGHVRYSTAGSSILKNAQPIVVDYSRGAMAVAHNGNLVNAALLRDELEAHGSIFQTTSDSEIIIHLLARPKFRNLEEALQDSLLRVKGAFSLVMMMPDKLIGVRDPWGFRPLCLGKLGKSYVLSSETCALDLIQAKFIREIEPGEIVIIDKRGLHSSMPFERYKPKKRFCIFELIYFARPDSHIFGENVHLFRQKLGMQLALEHPAQADFVMAVPDSGNSAALGFSHASGIPFEIGIVRNHYIGRTFIQPLQYIRDFNASVKLNPIKEIFFGKRIVLVDDSIVRGTTMKARVASLRKMGAEEVHLRVSCPPHISPCFYGIDFPTKKELIASKHSVNQIKKFLGVDSLGYLSLEGLLSCVAADRGDYCVSCFTGEYPIQPPEGTNKYAMEKGYAK